MEPKTSLLHSDFVIDGIPQEITPAEILFGYDRGASSQEHGTITDETIDPTLQGGNYDIWKLKEYVTLIRGCAGMDTVVPVAYSSGYTKLMMENALVDVLWRKGRFGLQDLEADLGWAWDKRSMGYPSAFYSSAVSASEYADRLGIRIGQAAVKEEDGASSLEVGVSVSYYGAGVAAEEFPPGEGDPHMDSGTAVSGSMVADPESWVIYIPFETCSYALAGSLLASSSGEGALAAPDPDDPDYFIDCYEVVREMVEDGIFLSARSIGRGGLMMAMEKFCEGTGAGLSAGIGTVMQSLGETDAVRLLFSEIPGALVQISDNDFDYFDGQFTLQDVAFYPVGHPAPGKSGVKIDLGVKDTVGNILESLLRKEASEGED